MEFGKRLFVSLILIGSSAPLLAAQVVQTEYGKVSGRQEANVPVTVFKGIAFAAPPVGDLRWRPPAPPAAWDGVRKADEFAPSCMQRTKKEFLPWTQEFLVQNQVSEDCLYLNVWTPQLSANANLPVIVFIHGGAFTEGSGGVVIYDGGQLASRGAVVVTVNYRVGAFGFFAHPDLTAESPHHSSGNYGLMDQIAALQWVKKNIAPFGGDPRRVTIWGQSAGAFSVAALIASPLSAGLFERAMADSGLGITGVPIMSLAAAEQAGVSFAAAHHAASIKDLRSIPAADLLPAPGDNSFHAGPDVDGWVLSDTPQALSARGVDRDVPIITGYQANDGLLAPPIHAPEEFDQMAQHEYGDLAQEFERLYPVSNGDEAQRMAAQSVQDRERVSMFLWASRRKQNHRQPVFTYYFDRAIPWPQHPEFGAFHTGEIPYFFMNQKFLDRPWQPIDFTVSKTASSYLVNFTATGDPNGTGLPEWIPVDPAHPATMEIGANTGPMTLASRARVSFWIRYFDSPAGKNAPLF